MCVNCDLNKINIVLLSSQKWLLDPHKRFCSYSWLVKVEIVSKAYVPLLTLVVKYIAVIIHLKLIQINVSIISKLLAIYTRLPQIANKN